MSSANDIQIGGNHYASSLQHWDVVELYGIGYIEGNATKYVTRWRKKNGIEDLRKAMHYLVKLIELATAKVRLPRGSVPADVYTMFVRENGLVDWEVEVCSILFGPWELADLESARMLLQGAIDSVLNEG